MQDTITLPSGLTAEDVTNITKYAKALSDANEAHERVISLAIVATPKDGGTQMFGAAPQTFAQIMLQAISAYFALTRLADDDACDCPTCLMQRAQRTSRRSFWDRILKRGAR
jgi:hypothetical protein